MNTPIWANARLFGWLRAIASAEGLDETLFAPTRTDATTTLAPLEALVAASNRLEEMVGGPEALLEAATRAPVVIEAVLSSTAATPAALIDHFLDVLLPTLLPNVSVTRTRGPLGDDRLSFAIDTDPLDSSLSLVIAGITAALPRAFEQPIADIHLVAGSTSQLTLTTPRAPSLVSADRITALAVGAVFTDLLDDRTRYQQDVMRGERIMSELARALHEANDVFALARAVAEALATELSLGFALIWIKTAAGSPRLIAQTGTRDAHARLVPLLCGDRHLGLIETSDCPEAHWVDALAPWIAGAVERLSRDVLPSVTHLPEPPSAWGLTRRQREVALLVATGASTNEIAAALGSSPRTIEEHVGSCLKKAGVANRATLAARLLDGHST